jgi:hypothetical protein
MRWFHSVRLVGGYPKPLNYLDTLTRADLEVAPKKCLDRPDLVALCTLAPHRHSSPRFWVVNP